MTHVSHIFKILPRILHGRIDSRSNAKVRRLLLEYATYDNVRLPISFFSNVNLTEVSGPPKITLLFNNHIQVALIGHLTDTLYVLCLEQIENEVIPSITPVGLTKINFQIDNSMFLFVSLSDDIDDDLEK
jgi:hypothetical protein